MDDDAKDKLAERAMKLVWAMAHDSDRAAVILGAARVDAVLDDLLAAVLLPSQAKTRERDELLGVDSPVGTFSARTKLARRLGLLGQDFADGLDKLRKVRNYFAHAHEMHVAIEDLPPKRAKDAEALIAPFRTTARFPELLRSVEEIQRVSGRAAELRVVISLLVFYLEFEVERAKRVEDRGIPLVNAGLNRASERLPPD